jgi:hypothetical protein
MVPKNYKKQLAGYLIASRIKKSPTAVPPDLAMYNFENGKPMPIACSNPDRLQAYLYGWALKNER